MAKSRKNQANPKPDLKPTNEQISSLRENQCRFFLPRKRRFCAMAKLQGQDYCSSHGKQEGYVVCPVDGSHMVRKDRLKQHIKVCPAAVRKNHLEKQPFYKQNINGKLGETSVSGSLVPLKTTAKGLIESMSSKEFTKLIEKVETTFQKYSMVIEKDLSLIDGVLMSEDFSVKKIKHITQQRSIIQKIDQHDLLSEDLLYMEMGAGKGSLSHTIQEVFSSRNILKKRDTIPPIKYVLVDRQAFNKKKDKLIRQFDPSYDPDRKEKQIVERIRIDISHLNLGGLELLKNKRCLCMSKHLCGVATDLCLTCFETTNSNQNSDKLFNNEGFFIALCCHQLCDWNCYVNQEFFTRNGFNQKDFEHIAAFSCWCLETEQNKDVKYPKGHALEHFTSQNRYDFGWKCKRLIDFGRMKYLEEKNYDCKLVEYVESTISPENYMLVAIPRT